MRTTIAEKIPFFKAILLKLEKDSNKFQNNPKIRLQKQKQPGLFCQNRAAWMAAGTDLEPVRRMGGGAA
jgi:hypothetical protein